jgi:hypothetical protein
MIMVLLTILSSLVLADPTWKWTNAIDIVEKHEFYQNNEIIQKPKDVWQTLFAVRYHDSNLKTSKDCVFYKVPGQEVGILKIKTIPENLKCESAIYQAADQEWRDLKALQFSIQKNLLSLNLTDAKFVITTWNVPLFNVFEKPVPKILMSSAEYRAARILFLKPYKGKLIVRPEKSKAQNHKQCHMVTEDCRETSPSLCHLCPQGWYEIPNGCSQGPKFCGTIICGTKGAPACRRGYIWQRKDQSYSCRDDSSFAYCAKGLKIQCEGNLPYCI